MSDGVFSLKGLFATAAMALAIDLLFVFPVSHFSSWGQAIATNMGTFWGFIPDASNVISAGTVSAAPTALASSGLVLDVP